MLLTTEIHRSYGTGMTGTIDNMRWNRASDGALLAENATTRDTSSQQSLTYTAPCLDLHWPLTVGATWTESCTAERSLGGGRPADTFTRSSTYHVVGAETVTVPAGTFAAFKITVNTTAGTTTQDVTEWYSPQACHLVKTVAVTGADTTTTELVSFSCKNPA